MTTYLRFSIVPAILVGVVLLLQAQDGARDASKGTVLLLKTGHAMEGDIEKVGSQFRVRRGKSEVWIAEGRAVRLCADWIDAYTFAQAQIKADNANDRVRLARWCHMHKLTEKALEQAQIALELQPTNADARQLITLLERALQEPKLPAQSPKGTPAPAVPDHPIEPAPTVDVSFETQVAFTTKVQPILMNKCAACHAGGAGGKFQMERVSESGQKGTSQRNLAAVLGQVDLDHPAISPLLVKAITRHGDALAPPLRDRSDKPVQAIQQWIQQTVARNPQLKDYARKHTPGRATPEPKASVFPTQRTAAPPEGSNVVSQSVPRLEIDVKSPPRVQPVETPRPPVSTTPADEFDAAHFNRWAHPAHFQQQAANSRP